MLLPLLHLITVKSVRFGFPLNNGKYDLYTSPVGVIIEREVFDAKFHIEKSHIGPNVIGYRVYPNVTVGKISKYKKNDRFPIEIFSSRSYERRLGYFILDLHTTKVYCGLSKQDWIKKLKEYNINDEPKLYKPSFLDDYLGRNKPE